jgi:ubiquinone biosynthesis protein
MTRELFGVAVLAPLLVLLAWLSGRLLGGRPRWWLALLSAWIGIAVGGATAVAVAVQSVGDVRAANPLIIWATALLVTMGISAAAELVARRPARRATPAARARPPTGLRRWGRRTRRMAQIGLILARHGLPRSWQPGPTRAVRLRLALEQAGGIFVKFGQVLSTRADLVPADFIAELAHLQDQAPPAPVGAIAALLAEELGATPEAVFAAFDAEPFAAASIAQVHRARLHSGEQVVVKVQRPGIRESVACDLDILLMLAGLAEAWTVWGRDLHIIEQATRFAEVVREELDFRVEAHNIAAVADALGPTPAVRTPAVFPHLSTGRVLVLEHLEGISIRAAGPRLDGSQLDRAALAHSLLEAMLRQVLVGGVFHADPHPGNVLLLQTGELALIDFGLVGRLDALQQAALREIVVAFERRDPAMLRDALLTLVDLRDTADGERLERALSQVLTRRLGRGMHASAALLGDMLRLLLDFGLAVPPDLSGLFRALITLEGTLTLLAPDVALIDAARALAANWFRDDLAPASLQASVRGEVLALLPLLRRLPRRLDRIASGAERGTLSVNVRLFADPRDVRVVAHLVGHVVLAGVGAAIGLMGVLLLGVPGGPLLTARLSLPHALGYGMLAASIMLLLRVIVAVARAG